MLPLAAAKVVVTAQRDATSPYPAGEIFRVLPGLKPYHPVHRMKVPKTCKLTE